MILSLVSWILREFFNHRGKFEDLARDATHYYQIKEYVLQSSMRINEIRRP